MVATTATRLVTADELLDFPDGYRCELIDGVVVEMSPAGYDHSMLIGELNEALVMYNVRAKIGKVWGADSGFLLRREPDTVLAPDLAVVPPELARRPPKGTQGFAPLPPIVAVEVKSPGDDERRIVEKTRLYLEAGVRELWWVRPSKRTVTRSTPDGDVAVFGDDDTLTSTVLPGFALPLVDLFGE